ncbi:hypothetical protein, partial [Campylobacter molothri]|uniref:hypothetical protein n=1 Tax=Campylobacter molothri TaxID=1032242 RepID=UPI00301BBBF3
MENVVLLGESHFAFKNGITQGLKNKGINVINLSLGGTAALQNLYELKRNDQILKNADLIISGSNTHDIAQYNSLESFPKSYQVINWLYKELYFLNKKVLCFIAPTPQKWLDQQCLKLVYTLHKKLIKKYSFNIIDLNGYYLEKNLYDFIRRDEAHDFDFIMREIGEKIANNIENFSFPKKLNILNDNPKFIALNVREMENIDENNFKNKTSWLCQEEIYELKNELEFNKIYHGYTILGVHIWNEQNNCELEIKNKNTNNSFNRNIDYLVSFFFDTYNRNIKITENTTILSKNNPVGFVGLLLASTEGNYHNENIDFKALIKENIEIEKEYNFNHLIPPIEWYKEIIDEYCSIMDPIKLEPLQNQINTLKIQLSNSQANSAKARIQNQLSYKLGQAMIENSKSI